MKWFFTMMLPVLVLASCSKEAVSPREYGEFSTKHERPVMHDAIVLGKKLDNPYSVANVRKALNLVYPTRSGAEIDPNGLYVRFLPKNEAEVNRLSELGLELFDHPLDYEILQEGDFYHDESLPEEQITWQYTLVPPDFNFPAGIEHQLLDECYLPEEDEPATKGAEGIDWNLIEREAFRLSGNETLLLPETRGRRTRPEGRITIEDPKAKSKRIVGVSGVKVVTNVFVRFSSTYTDRNGKYSIRKKYSAMPHYRLEFRNVKGFSIGLNLILQPASSSGLGKGAPSGLNVKIDENSDGTLFRRCVVNNAAYDYYDICHDLGVDAPASNIRIWIMKRMNLSSALMAHHGSLLNNRTADRFLGIYKYILRVFLPDITIGVKTNNDYAGLYGSTIHEMAHASHFKKVGSSYWNKYIGYVLTSFAGTGSGYGDGSGADAGYCEVGEMWACYMENKIFKERYGYSKESGYNQWFHPQIFASLESGGLTASQIFAGLRSSVTDVDSLRDKLLELYPEKKSLITRTFKAFVR